GSPTGIARLSAIRAIRRGLALSSRLMYTNDRPASVLCTSAAGLIKLPLQMLGTLSGPEVARRCRELRRRLAAVRRADAHWRHVARMPVFAGCDRRALRRAAEWGDVV